MKVSAERPLDKANELIVGQLFIHLELDQLFKNHIFIGIADLTSARSCIQHQTKMYLVKHNVIAFVAPLPHTLTL